MRKKGLIRDYDSKISIKKSIKIKFKKHESDL